MEALFGRSPEDRAMVRAWASGSTEVEMDRQGRVAIPGYLREYAHLEDAVLIHGAITHIGCGIQRSGRSGGCPGTPNWRTRPEPPLRSRLPPGRPNRPNRASLVLRGHPCLQTNLAHQEGDR